MEKINGYKDRRGQNYGDCDRRKHNFLRFDRKKEKNWKRKRLFVGKNQ